MVYRRDAEDEFENGRAQGSFRGMDGVVVGAVVLVSL
jgi:hypothetical protein